MTQPILTPSQKAALLGDPISPTTTADRFYDLLCRERDKAQEEFDACSLAPFVAANNTAVWAWHQHASAENWEAVKQTDMALQEAALADHKAVHIYTWLLLLKSQIKAHLSPCNLN